MTMPDHPKLLRARCSFGSSTPTCRCDVCESAGEIERLQDSHLRENAAAGRIDDAAVIHERIARRIPRDHRMHTCECGAYRLQAQKDDGSWVWAAGCHACDTIKRKDELLDGGVKVTHRKASESTIEELRETVASMHEENEKLHDKVGRLMQIKPGETTLDQLMEVYAEVVPEYNARKQAWRERERVLLAEVETLAEANKILASGEALREVAEASRLLIDEMNAPNYVEVVLARGDDEEPSIVMTLQRADGETPHALRKKAEAELAQAAQRHFDFQAEIMQAVGLPMEECVAEVVTNGSIVKAVEEMVREPSPDPWKAENAALCAEVETKGQALRNVLMLAQRMSRRGVDDAEHLIRFCAEGDIKPSFLRDALAEGDRCAGCQRVISDEEDRGECGDCSAALCLECEGKPLGVCAPCGAALAQGEKDSDGPPR